MQTSRRHVLLVCGAVLSGSLPGFEASWAQDATSGKRRPDDPDDSTNNPNSPTVRPGSSKAMLEERQKSIKKDVQKLYDLAAQLKTEVEKTDSTTILSLGMVKKAEEIEKLAKEIKARAKG